jgi:hypothetical protein
MTLYLRGMKGGLSHQGLARAHNEDRFLCVDRFFMILYLLSLRKYVPSPESA